MMEIKERVTGEAVEREKEAAATRRANLRCFEVIFSFVM